MTPDLEKAKAGWDTPKPETICRPTYLPAALALGITFLFWGLVTSLVILVAGAAVIVISLVGWIGEMRREQ